MSAKCTKRSARLSDSRQLLGTKKTRRYSGSPLAWPFSNPCGRWLRVGKNPEVTLIKRHLVGGHDVAAINWRHGLDRDHCSSTYKYEFAGTAQRSLKPKKWDVVCLIGVSRSHLSPNRFRGSIAKQSAGK